MKEKKTEDKENVSVQELIMDHKSSKYVLINYALRWAKHIAKREDVPKTTSGLIDAALKDILTEKVTYKEIDKLPKLKESKRESKTTVAPDKNGKKSK